jgi:farnesol kinase
MTNENKRQSVHILLFILAFALKFLGRWQAFLLLAVLLLITLFLVPKSKVKAYLYRPTENKYSQGAVLYFLVLLVLILIFPLPIVAVTWAILACGDGAATLVGKHFKAKELSWNRHKTYAGSLAFVIFGFLGAYILIQWSFGLSHLMAVSICLKTVLVAALVESLPLRLNDNVSVAVVSALVLNYLI